MPSEPTRKHKNHPINESLIHYVWKTRSFISGQLLSTDERPIDILSWGTPNVHAGPDFSNVRIEYNGLVWAGHAEMHVKSSDWRAHKHGNDPNYQNVILHVVYEDDEPLIDLNGLKVPTIELKERIPSFLIKNATSLITNASVLSCQEHIRHISAFWINDWKEKQIIERLEEKVIRINDRLSKSEGDWEQVVYELLARSIGHGINSDQMETLSRRCPWKLLRKIIVRREMIEALLFGASGLLDIEANDESVMKLQSDFNFLRNKYQLKKERPIKWNFMRSRPSNFPTIRISQLAGILHNRFSLLHSIVDLESIQSLKNLIRTSASAYWRTHYVFGKKTDNHSVKLGTHAQHIIMINTCIPLTFAYGSYCHISKLKQKALHYLYQLPAEHNSVMRKWKQAGISAGSAADSQGLLYTYNEYCCAKRCLDCRLGHRIIHTKKDHKL